MYYNPRTNKIECPYCRTQMKPFGGRFTRWYSDLPEVFLCIDCGYAVDMQEAIAEALYQRSVINWRYANAERHYMNENGNGHKSNGYIPYRSIRQRVLKALVTLLEE